MQVAFFDPGVLGNVGFGTNGPNYRIRGVETSFIARAARGLTAQGCGFLEQQRADQLAVPDCQQSRAAGESGDQRGGIRQADPERQQSVRPGRRSERQFAAAAVQSAPAISLGDQRTTMPSCRPAPPTRRIRSRSRAPIRRSRRATTSAPRLLRFENPAYYAV